jgi:tetratricopeptide (TPR) repeat protein
MHASRAIARFSRADHAGARADLRAAIDLELEIGDTHNAAGNLSNLAQMLTDLGDLDGARRALDEATELNRKRGDRAQLARQLEFSGYWHMRVGRLDEARALFDEMRAGARAAGQDDDVGLALVGIGLEREWGGRPSEARALLDEALALFRRSGDASADAMARANLGDTLVDLGNLDAGRRELVEASGAHARLGKVDSMASCWRGLARVALFRRALAEAEMWARAAAGLFREAERPAGVADAFALLGWILAEEGRGADAAAAAETAQAAGHGVAERPVALRVAIFGARVHGADAAAAAETADARAAGLVELELEARLAQADILRRHDRARGARVRDQVEADARRAGYLTLADLAARPKKQTPRSP